MVDWEARWRAGDATAIELALMQCWQQQQAPPVWLVGAVHELVKARTDGAEKRARKEFDRHVMRWMTVLQAKPGRTWTEAYEAAAAWLAGSFAAGEADTMRGSYQKIQSDGRFASVVHDLTDTRGRVG
jgi:uncharacterized NAD(P)/FAD-binding protein YdhS